MGIRLYADGGRHDLIRIPAGGSRMPATAECIGGKAHTMRMNGAPLFRLAVKKVEHAIREILKEFGVHLHDVSQFVLHQANGRILAQLTQRLGVVPDQVCSVIDRFGNTSSASLPIALDHAARSGRVRSDDTVLLGSFGGGLTWATGLVRWS
jgi:3-oxoacyl-[acyl-carrier-protein] synthase-3